MHASSHTQTHTRTHARTRTRTRTRTHAHKHTHAHTHTHTHARTHTRTHAHTHTRTHAHTSALTEVCDVDSHTSSTVLRESCVEYLRSTVHHGLSLIEECHIHFDGARAYDGTVGQIAACLLEVRRISSPSNIPHQYSDELDRWAIFVCLRNRNYVNITGRHEIVLSGK